MIELETNQKVGGKTFSLSFSEHWYGKVPWCRSKSDKLCKHMYGIVTAVATFQMDINSDILLLKSPDNLTKPFC